MTPQGKWYLDAFLKNGKTNKGVTLIDSTKLHDSNKWYWVALVYDCKKMTSYVNAIKKLEGNIDFPLISTGSTSLGVRLIKPLKLVQRSNQRDPLSPQCTQTTILTRMNNN